jgi:hypothetical protein
MKITNGSRNEEGLKKKIYEKYSNYMSPSSSDKKEEVI